MFLLNRKKTKQHNQTKETEHSKVVQDKALVILGHDLWKSHSLAWQFGEALQSPVLPAAVFLSFPGLIVLLATLWQLFLHISLTKKSLPALLFLEYFRSKSNRSWSKPGLGSMWKGSSGWRPRGKHHLGHSRRVYNSSCYPRFLIKLG